MVAKKKDVPCGQLVISLHLQKLEEEGKKKCDMKEHSINACLFPKGKCAGLMWGISLVS